jgi:thioredoxin-related protein
MFSLTCLGQGIQFEKGLTWNQIQEKAKKENKYIFVDCYATWCGPCKMMDEKVYPLKEVGDYYNAHFISVKVQMDKTDKDDSLVKKWYRDASILQNTYSITAFPSFLFFSANGDPVHKVVGSMSAENFIALAHDAENPGKQYYSILKNFQPGKLDTSELKGLARSFRFTNKELAGKMVADYFHRIPKSEWSKKGNLQFLVDLSSTPEAAQIANEYLRTVPLDSISNQQGLRLINAFNKDSAIAFFVFNYLRSLNKVQLAKKSNLDLISIFKADNKFREFANNYISSLSKYEALKKDNLSFIRSFINSSSDKGFEIFLKNAKKIDKIMDQKNYAESSIDKIISKEIVDPFINTAKKNNSEPDWSKLSAIIRSKYNSSYAERNILSAKPGYYKSIKHWKEYAKYLVQYVNHYAPLKPEAAFYLNNMAWAIFENTDNPNDLNKANKWMEVVMKSDSTSEFFGGYMDTKANIMYRLGQTKEAIAFEEQAIALEKRRDPKTKSYTETLEKMKRGEKTWSEKVEGK